MRYSRQCVLKRVLSINHARPRSEQWPSVACKGMRPTAFCDDRPCRRDRTVPTECWTIIHHQAAVATHAVHAFGQVVHQHFTHGAHLAVRSHAWVQVVCRSMAAAVIGAGLLVPGPAPLRPSAPTSRASQPPSGTPDLPAVGLSLGDVGLGWTVGLEMLPPAGGPLVASGPPPMEPAPEPSSAVLLLTGLAGRVGALAGRRRRSLTAGQPPIGGSGIRWVRRPPARSRD